MPSLERTEDGWILTCDLSNLESIKPIMDMFDIEAIIKKTIAVIYEEDEAALHTNKAANEVRRKTMPNVEVTIQETVKVPETIGMNTIAVYPYEFSNGQKIFTVIIFQDDKLFPEDGDYYFFTSENLLPEFDPDIWFRKNGRVFDVKDMSALRSMLKDAETYPYIQIRCKGQIENEEMDVINEKIKFVREMFRRLDDVIGK